ncbi:hypothetical protein DL93DRAFT_2078412 [Clavulina sp. PMI_390]|nr:hypothetical protein DL93DRAFT_2078412 [Clavulina sp. PMI_390]
MAGMARRRGTWPIRLAIFPFALAAMLRFIYGFAGDDDSFNHLVGMWGLHYCIRLVDYVLSPEPMLKLSEGQTKKDAEKQAQPTSSWAVLRSLFLFIYDAFELLFTIRGFEWRFGAEIGLRRPRQQRPITSRAHFVIKKIYDILSILLLCDFAQTVVQIAHVGGEEHGSMFAFGGDNLAVKYTISTMLQLMSGILVIYGLELINCFLSLVGVLCGSDPASWPPLFDNPWISTSLHELWGRRWHQLFRRSLLVIGGYPLATILSWVSTVRGGKLHANAKGSEVRRRPLNPVAVAIGTCVASGLLHTWNSYAQRSGRMPGLSTVAFFGAQGVALSVEWYWKRITGSPVGGFWGWLWVFFWMAIVAQPLVEDWHQLGFLDISTVPPEQSPTRLFIIPFVQGYLPTLLPASPSSNT